MKKRESIDLAIILVWPIIATIITFSLKLSGFWGVILFLALPPLYLGFRRKQYLKKALIFALATCVLLMVWIEYIAEITGTWFVPSTIFPFKLFGIVVIEVIMWAFFTGFFIVMFYEYFIDKHATKRLWSPKLKYIFIIGLIVFFVFLFTLFAFPSLLKIPYFYLVFGVVILLIPFLIQLFRYPKTTSKFFLAAAYFFYLHFLLEVLGLKMGWWSFPGPEFIGWVKVFGVSFPIEEFIFWFILLALATLSYYEFFDDDEK